MENFVFERWKQITYCRVVMEEAIQSIICSYYVDIATVLSKPIPQKQKGI